MKKELLDSLVAEARHNTKTALQTVYNALNNGQQKQLLKNEKVKRLFDLYEVIE